MAAEEDEVDIEGIGEGDDLVDYKDMMENTDVINYPKKANTDRSSSSFFSEFCDPSSWLVDPNAVLSLEHCEDEKSRQTIEKMILEEELYSHGYGRMLEITTTTPVSGTNKTVLPAKKTHILPKAKRCLSSKNIPVTHRKPWTKHEQQLFELGLGKYGRSWTRISTMIDTRTVLQVKNYANQYFKNKEKTKEDYAPSSGLNGYSVIKPSSVDHMTSTSKAPIDTGPLVHIEKTNDEEEIEVDIDGDDDVHEAPIKPDNDTNEVYEALLKSVSDSEDSESGKEERGGEVTSRNDQSDEPTTIAMGTAAQINQPNKLQSIAMETSICQSHGQSNVVMETSSEIDQSNDVKDVTMETSVVNESSGVNESIENTVLVKDDLNGFHKEEISDNEITGNVNNEKNGKDSECIEIETQASNQCTSEGHFTRDLDSDVEKSDYTTTTCTDGLPQDISCSKDPVGITKTVDTNCTAPLHECSSTGEETINESTLSEINRPTLDLSQINLQINRDKIHEVEKAWNQEFFMGRSLKTPIRYIKIRNHIIDMWEKCRPDYLYKTSVRTGLKNCGDVNSIGRVHAFLEEIGAINASCPERPRPRPRPTLESGNELADYPTPMESWVNFLRPRKRRVKDEGGDWMNESEAEGLTIEHSSMDDEEDPKQVTERPARRPRAAKKKFSYNPFLLVPCQQFPSPSAHPFAVIFQSDSLVVIDVHSHLSTTEVIGLLGGTYSSTQRVLKVLRAAPCKSLSTGMQCEMDPVSQTQASEELASVGLSVVGWYHSHPTFAPSPSVRDIETQGKFQEWFGKGGAPFVGVIASPYNYNNTSNQSQITTMTVSDEWGSTDQYRLPYEFDYSIQDDVTDWSTVMESVQKLEEQYRCYEYRMPMTRRYGSSAFTALDKLVESLRPRLRGTDEEEQQFIDELRNNFTKDGETWSNERQESTNESHQGSS